MLIDFLYNLKPVFDEEARDLSALTEELGQGAAFVGFMPAVVLDLWPIYALGCTGASRFTGAHSLHKVYFMPVDVNECAIYPALRETVRSFYTETEKTEIIPEKRPFFSFFSSKKEENEVEDPLCGIKIEEIIPMDLSELSGSYPLRLSKICDCNVLYFRLKLPNLGQAHLFAVASSPEKVWQSVLERFDIRADMIIHSRKGFGHWFSSTSLYRMLLSTKKPHLLPKYYFKGRFITENDAPPASELLDTLADDEKYGNSMIFRIPDILREV